jgi:hypothetical protein
MNIIQSFFLSENKVPYEEFTKGKKKSPLLNFYSFFASFLLLKKTHGDVTLICNQSAYDQMFKYIPYNNIIIKDELVKEEYSKFWSLNKLSSYLEINTPFIHVDGDVLLFNKYLLKPFNLDKYDIICQNYEDVNTSSHYHQYNKLFKNDKKIKAIIGDNFEYGRPVNCGVVGIKNEELKNEYLNKATSLFKYVKENYSNIDSSFPIYLEQYLLGILINDYNLKIKEILETELINKVGIFKLGDKIGYTHLWGNSKYNYISYLKNIITKINPMYLENINKFENKNVLIN